MKRGSKSIDEPMYSSLHLTQMIKYIILLLFQERPPFKKYVLPCYFRCKFHLFH